MFSCALCHEPAENLHRLVIRPDVPRPWDALADLDGDYREAMVCRTCRDELIGSVDGTAEIGGKRLSVAAVTLIGGEA